MLACLEPHIKCGCGSVLEGGYQRHLTQLPFAESIVVPTPQRSFMPLTQGVFFYRHRDRLYLQGSRRECYTVCVCVHMSVCTWAYIHICHTYGHAGSRGNFPLAWPFPRALESPSSEALHRAETSKHFHDHCVFLA